MDSNLRSERLSNGKGSAHHSPATFFTRDLAMAPRGGESAMEEWWARSQRQRDLASRFHRSCRLRLRVCECVLLIAVGCDISAPKRVKVGYHLLAPRLKPGEQQSQRRRNNSRQACDGRSCRTDELQHLERVLCQLTVELRERLRAARSLKHCPQLCAGLGQRAQRDIDVVMIACGEPNKPDWLLAHVAPRIACKDRDGAFLRQESVGD